jgi:ADP-dependent NAD(P)H-hydrate dehydratase / NAD(P)H-hydrate epimerase
MKVFRVAEMVAAEKAADAAGHSYDQMMEAAGRAVAEAIIERYPVAGRQVTILVGPGNNGGDGLVAGRYLAEAGADVTFYLFKARDVAEDSNLAQVQAMGLFAITTEFDQRYRVLRTRLNITDILIDALLGTGVSRPITGELAKMMQQVQAGLAERSEILTEQQQRQALVNVAQVAPAGRPPGNPPQPVVVAVDCPSGLNCDTGELDRLAFPANLTVTFAGPKHGHFIFPGAAACGELVVADIGISSELPEVAGVAVELVTAGRAAKMLPRRPADGHNGTFGWVLIAAGSARYWGAPGLAGRAAYRTGAGLVALAVPQTIKPSLAGQLPEATYPLVADRDILSGESAQALLKEMAAYSAVLIGPGLDSAGDFLESMLAADLPPLVLDADGLNLLTQMDDWPARLPAGTILTPHLGEMARLTGRPLAELKEWDRVALAQEMAAAWRCILLLKGAYTVVAAPDGRCTILPFANPALATAGSGDVLSGIIVALLGQGLAPYDAAMLGGYLHGAAGQLSGRTAGLLASEIADYVVPVWQQLTAA